MVIENTACKQQKLSYDIDSTVSMVMAKLRRN